MAKRKLEDDDDGNLDWETASKQSYRAKRSSAPRAVAATHRVKDEPHEDEDYAPTTIGQSAETSTSGNLSHNSQEPRGDRSTAVSGVLKRGKRVKKEVDAGPPPEKRLARLRKSCPKNIQDRLERVMAQRMFLVDRDRQGEELQEEFKVLGSTGNVYTVIIKHLPSCDCPDALKGNHCKHLLFVLCKVLGVPANSPNIYQKALLTSELREIFENAPLSVAAAIQQSGLQKAWTEATGSPVKTTAEEKGGQRRIPEEGDTCPICFDDFDADGEGLVFCETSCGRAVHSICIAQWLATKPEATCIYCRAPWPKTGAGASAGGGPVGRDGRYVNLANAAGLSGRRDTTTYYHGPQRGMTQAEAYYTATARYNNGRAPRADDYGADALWWE